MENKEIKKEEPDYTGQDFLLNDDKQHKYLLAELNKEMKKYNECVNDYNKKCDEYNEKKEKFHKMKKETDDLNKKYNVAYYEWFGKARLSNDDPRLRNSNYVYKIMSEEARCLFDKVVNMSEKTQKEAQEAAKLFKDIEAIRKVANKNRQEMADFVSNNYRTFVARLHNGIHIEILKTLFEREKGSFTYPVAQKIFEEANNRGLIFVIAFNKVYLVDPREKEEKEEYSFLKEIRQHLNVNNRVFVNGLACRSGDVQLSNDIINYYWDVLEGKNGGVNNIKIIPPINGILSFISSQQTPVVENTCKVVNAIIDAYREKCSEKKMPVELKGISQGVDFITKMVGSGHGKNDRLKNAEVTLEIISAHKLTNEEDILKRLLEGSKYNTTIKEIKYGYTQNDRMHPIEYTKEIRDFLEKNLKAKGIKYINNKHLTNYMESNQCLSSFI